MKSRPSQASKPSQVPANPSPAVLEWFNSLPEWCKALGLASALAHPGCAPQVQQVPVEQAPRQRVLGHVVSQPGPEECPPGAMENHRALGLNPPMSGWFELVEPYEADHWRNRGPQQTRVRAGEVQGWLREDIGELPQDTVLKGRLYFGLYRVYGRFTEAHLPGGGDILPVCFEMTNDNRQYGAKGRAIRAEQPQDGTVTIKFGGGVRVVERFK